MKTADRISSYKGCEVFWLHLLYESLMFKPEFQNTEGTMSIERKPMPVAASAWDQVIEDIPGKKYNFCQAQVRVKRETYHQN